MDLGDTREVHVEPYVVEDDISSLRSDFLIGVIVIGVSLLLIIILVIILYAWIYTVEKKLKQSNLSNPTDFKIRRAQIRDDASRTPTAPNGIGQNPLSRSSNFNAVVDDLKRTSASPSVQQTRLHNYLADNNNFSY